MFLKGLRRASDAHKEALNAAKWLAELIGHQKETVTITDVTRYISPKALGQASGAVFRGGPWEFVGYERSERLERQSGTIGRWRLKRVVAP
jgi:hypothetical protein